MVTKVHCRILLRLQPSRYLVSLARFDIGVRVQAGGPGGMHLGSCLPASSKNVSFLDSPGSTVSEPLERSTGPVTVADRRPSADAGVELFRGWVITSAIVPPVLGADSAPSTRGTGGKSESRNNSVEKIRDR